LHPIPQVFEKYPNFQARIRDALREILPSGRRVRFLRVTD
jgi:hypothetical protein